ncbi:MAG: transposase [Thermanaeromonas sp.]|uniref:RNA-guided endonuclease InsQ/TnpB family protein n=1 Tax=Thermanaeromonas sp. TaxID=2003697 RepID=UPI0024407DB8|nr:transposase [Thermanaeromonas sp.]MCG0278196.1 transposase [Thermanaeromonas sp.]
MKRTNVIRVLPDKRQKRVLEIIGDRCAALWNVVQFRCRQAFLKGEPVPSYEALCSEFKEHPAYKALPAHIGQEVIKKARRAWDAFFACLRLYRKGKLAQCPSLPRYWKDRKTGKRFFRVIPVKAPTSYSLTAKILSLTLPRDLRNGSGDRLLLHTKGLLKFHGQPKTLELKYDPVKRRWYAHQVVEVPDPVAKARPPKCAGLDLGARTFGALAVEGLDYQLLFSGRELWKDFLYWTKMISREQARLNRTGRKTSRKLKLLYRKRSKRLKHAFEALAKQIARILKKNGVGTLFIENLTDIRADMDFGPQNLLVHNFWTFRMLRKAIEDACVKENIVVVPVEPQGTSSTCAVCGGLINRLVRNKAYCPNCGLVWHADANAALNILLKGSSKGHGAEATPQRPLVLRWNRHRWESRLKSAVGTPLRAANSVPEAA